MRSHTHSHTHTIWRWAAVAMGTPVKSLSETYLNGIILNPDTFQNPSLFSFSGPLLVLAHLSMARLSMARCTVKTAEAEMFLEDYRTRGEGIRKLINTHKRNNDVKEGERGRWEKGNE